MYNAHVRFFCRLMLVVIAVLLCPMATAKVIRDYDIVYVRQARFGDNNNATWPEVFHPAALDPGADLMLLHPNGSEEVLVAGGNGGVTDPFVSFDAQWVYYSYFSDLRPSGINSQWTGWVQHQRERAIEQLGYPGLGCGSLQQLRHLGSARAGDGTQHASQLWPQRGLPI